MRELVCTLLLTALLAATAAAQQGATLAEIRQAAEAGDATAQAKLGDAFRGRLDLVEAEAWYRSVAWKSKRAPSSSPWRASMERGN